VASSARFSRLIDSRVVDDVVIASFLSSRRRRQRRLRQMTRRQVADGRNRLLFQKKINAQQIYGNPAKLRVKSLQIPDPVQDGQPRKRNRREKKTQLWPESLTIIYSENKTAEFRQPLNFCNQLNRAL